MNVFFYDRDSFVYDALFNLYVSFDFECTRSFLDNKILLVHKTLLMSALLRNKDVCSATLEDYENCTRFLAEKKHKKISSCCTVNFHEVTQTT